MAGRMWPFLCFAGLPCLFACHHPCSESDVATRGWRALLESEREHREERDEHGGHGPTQGGGECGKGAVLARGRLWWWWWWWVLMRPGRLRGTPRWPSVVVESLLIVCFLLTDAN